jgi:hypothetical protein
MRKLHYISMQPIDVLEHMARPDANRLAPVNVDHEPDVWVANCQVGEFLLNVCVLAADHE